MGGFGGPEKGLWFGDEDEDLDEDVAFGAAVKTLNGEELLEVEDDELQEVEEDEDEEIEEEMDEFVEEEEVVLDGEEMEELVEEEEQVLKGDDGLLDEEAEVCLVPMLDGEAMDGCPCKRMVKGNWCWMDRKWLA